MTPELKGRQAPGRLLRDAGEILRTDLILIVKRKLVVSAIWMNEQAMRPALTLHSPTEPFERSEHAASFSCWPVAHRG